MTVAGVFTFALGFGSWATLNEQRKQARESMDKLKGEVESDFPMLGRMGRNFSKVLTGLTEACGMLEIKDKTYTSLSWAEEQGILFYESAMSTSMLLNTEGRSKEISKIYRLLGVFYGSKFFSSLNDGKLPTNEGLSPVGELDASFNIRDLDRARFYFDKAIELDEKNYLAYLSAGYFTQYPEYRPLATVSRDYFKKAAILESDKFSGPFSLDFA
jgi:hypothetical protein